MKTMKRFMALAIALILSFALAIPASAANITIEGSNGVTYTAYKIFDAEGTSKDAVVYTKIDSVWNALSDTAKGYVTVDTNNSNYVTAISNAASFATETLKASLSAADSVTLDDSNKTLTLDDGYYVMKSSGSTNPFAFTVLNGALVGIDSHYASNIIKDKAELPSVTKEADKADAAMGETITYTTTITAKVGAVKYVLHDAAEAGITINTTSIEVTYKGSVITSGFTVKTDTGVSDGCDFEIHFEDGFCSGLATGDEIKVTYTGVLNATAEISTGTNTNTTWLTHGESGELKTTDGTADVETYKLTVKKTDGTNPLTGAKFALYSDEACTQAVNVTGSGDTYTLGGTSNEIDATSVSTFTIKGLKGTYYLKETKAPTGYQLPTAATKIEITKNQEVTITNTTGKALPETGGIGTTIFYAVGGVLMVGALALVLLRKRTGAN